MAWYRTGTVNVTNNSNTVVGAGTAWVQAASIGETFLGPDSQVYEIVAINSATSLTIAPVYKGSTASAQGYAIMPTQGYLRDLAAAAAALVESYSSVKNNAGTGKFAAGTSANPSLRNAADENTGLNLKGSDQLALVTAGVERLALSASGVPSGTAVTHMLDRTTHTGTQAISTVSGLQAALDTKAASHSPVLTGTPSVPNLKFGNVESADVNTLDYYEEGNWTPTLFGKTTTGTNTYHSENGGSYTRIGNVVHYTAILRLETSTGMSGQLVIGGLPYINRSGQGRRGGVVVGGFDGVVAGYAGYISGLHNSALASIDLLNGRYTAFIADNTTGNFRLFFSGTYTTN